MHIPPAACTPAPGAPAPSWQAHRQRDVEWALHRIDNAADTCSFRHAARTAQRESAAMRRLTTSALAVATLLRADGVDDGPHDEGRAWQWPAPSRAQARDTTEDGDTAPAAIQAEAPRGALLSAADAESEFSNAWNEASVAADEAKSRCLRAAAMARLLGSTHWPWLEECVPEAAQSAARDCVIERSAEWSAERAVVQDNLQTCGEHVIDGRLNPQECLQRLALLADDYRRLHGHQPQG